VLREARRQKDLPEIAVPRVAVLDPDGDIVRYLAAGGRGRRHPGWACYHTDMWTVALDSIEPELTDAYLLANDGQRQTDGVAEHLDVGGQPGREVAGLVRPHRTHILNTLQPAQAQSIDLAVHPSPSTSGNRWARAGVIRSACRRSPRSGGCSVTHGTIFLVTMCDQEQRRCQHQDDHAQAKGMSPAGQCGADGLDDLSEQLEHAISLVGGHNAGNDPGELACPALVSADKLCVLGRLRVVR
jgi:hypothetical protein